MKHLKIKAILAALMLAAAMTGCAEMTNDPAAVQVSDLTADIEPQAPVGTEPNAEFLSAQAGFALSLMQETAKAHEGENILLSPYSMMEALAMTASGAAGDTRTDMENALGGIQSDSLNAYLCYLRTTLPDTDGNRFKTANSVWFRNDADRIQVLPGFLQTAKNYFDADVFSEPFQTQTRDHINQWCSEKTGGMIPTLLNDDIPAEAVMYLINAVCFDAKWEHIYEDEPVPRDFTASDGRVQQAQMMYSEEGRYLEDDHATGFLKYYQDRVYAFAALLPEEGMTPESYLSQLTPEGLQYVLTGMHINDVEAGLPQFSYDFDTEMNQTLIDMGMGSAFRPDANFSDMAKTQTDELYISKVLQKTHIDVDTEGTKAAAVSAVIMTDGASAVAPEPKYVYLDRPFVYMIVDTRTMIPFFFGIVNSVEG